MHRSQQPCEGVNELCQLAAPARRTRSCPECHAVDACPEGATLRWLLQLTAKGSLEAKRRNDRYLSHKTSNSWHLGAQLRDFGMMDGMDVHQAPSAQSRLMPSNAGTFVSFVLIFSFSVRNWHTRLLAIPSNAISLPFESCVCGQDLSNSASPSSGVGLLRSNRILSWHPLT